jgi:ubiquinone/menaquinone biosynthesis C-methylase UbiE
MSGREYTPPLGTGDTSDYDRAIRRWTRERRWREATLRYLAPAAGETIVDVGCGTGTFAVLAKRSQPDAHVIGIDPDEEALSIARAKARAASAMVEYRRGFAQDLPPGAADAIVSSLVLHQVPLPGKQQMLAAMHAALRPGGRLILVDYLRQTGVMRVLFRATVQRLDGVSDTQPNADGAIPELVRKAGFVELGEPWRIATPSGSIGLIAASRADR